MRLLAVVALVPCALNFPLQTALIKAGTFSRHNKYTGSGSARPLFHTAGAPLLHTGGLHTKIHCGGYNTETQTLEQYFERALVLQRAGDTEAALGIYQMMVQATEGEIPLASKAELFNNMATCEARLQKWVAARSHWELAVQCRPDLAEAHFNLAIILLTRLNDPNAAERHCLQSMQQMKGDFPLGNKLLEDITAMKRKQGLAQG